MKRTNVVVELQDSVLVPGSEVGGLDPVNEAIRHARKHMGTPYSEDVQQFEYGAERTAAGDYRVVVTGVAAASHFGDRRDVSAAASKVSRGSFEEKRVVNWTVSDVEAGLADRLTVADLRELGREHGVSYPRGASKREMVRELVDQAPGTAKDLAP